MKKRLPKWLKWILCILIFLILSEVILRFYFGLGDLAVYREDEDYEYFYEANQDVWRFGNHIVTNEYGMRSKKVNKKKKITILEFGDSVLNGGAHLDQNELATTLEEKELNRKFGDEVQVLNVSAQSWGLSNAFAFLKKHGNFNADIIVLVFSGDDLQDNMHFRKVVGKHLAWPNEKPLLAITDAWSRFVWPFAKNLILGNDEYDYLKGFDDSKTNPGWKNFFEYAKNNKIPLMVFLHASKTEVERGAFLGNGKKIMKMCQESGVDLVTDLHEFKKTENAFIDNVHLNETGHLIMADLMIPVLENILKRLP